MKMQITLDHMTTSKTLRLLAALETAELFEETDLTVATLDTTTPATTLWSKDDLAALPNATPKAAQEGEKEQQPEESSEETQQAAHTPVNATATTTATTAQVPWQRKFKGYKPQPVVGLPVIGRVTRARLIPLRIAESMLEWGQGRLTYLVSTKAIETITERHGEVNYHYLTPEQVTVLRTVAFQLDARNRKRISRSALKKATTKWLATHPDHTPRTLPIPMYRLG